MDWIHHWTDLLSRVDAYLKLSHGGPLRIIQLKGDKKLEKATDNKNTVFSFSGVTAVGERSELIVWPYYGVEFVIDARVTLLKGTRAAEVAQFLNFPILARRPNVPYVQLVVRNDIS